MISLVRLELIGTIAVKSDGIWQEGTSIYCSPGLVNNGETIEIPIITEPPVETTIAGDGGETLPPDQTEAPGGEKTEAPAGGDESTTVYVDTSGAHKCGVIVSILLVLSYALLS
eukprot:Selendium_serpulae@DN6237_c1_g1_i12.p1